MYLFLENPKKLDVSYPTTNPDLNNNKHAQFDFPLCNL